MADDAKYRVFEAAPGVIGIDDDSHSTSYLIEGSERALLIDTGWGADNFIELVNGLTRKKVAVALTHMHGDHTRHAGRFEPVYLHGDDIALLRAQEKCPPWVERARPLSDGSLIDLGGLEVEVLAVPGHTPGSVAFADAAHGALFTGDAIGSGVGVWMQVGTAIPLRAYQRGLRHFLARVAPFGPLAYLGGHIGRRARPASRATIRQTSGRCAP